MIDRTGELETLAGLLGRHRVVAILGARQVGKTTLASRFARKWPQPVTYFDLERMEPQ
jgi:predicted AAA+ superfamily ATPase